MPISIRIEVSDVSTPFGHSEPYTPIAGSSTQFDWPLTPNDNIISNK
uniref:Uncharacterized protein n=1 Tax=viral metagenome TaxID=1070528 RepID=A0A6C0KI86_9ZZZZ